MEKTLILKHISGMLCLLISYSKFTRPANPDALNDWRRCAILPIWKTTEPGGLPSLSEGLPSRRKKGGRCQWLHILI